MTLHEPSAGSEQPRLSLTARYRLEILSRGPRLYQRHDHQMQALARHGLVEAQPGPEPGRACLWAITGAGMARLGAWIAPSIKEEPHP